MTTMTATVGAGVHAAVAMRDTVPAALLLITIVGDQRAPESEIFVTFF